MLLSLSNAGIGNFGVVALMSGYGASFSTANIALTALSRLPAPSACWRAAFSPTAPGATARSPPPASRSTPPSCWSSRSSTLPPVLLTAAMAVAGFLGGVIAPSRDMLVRNAAPPGAAGRAFGIVSTGFNIGGIISPLLFGWIMDQNMPHWVFGASVVFMALTVLLALVTDRNPQTSVEKRRRQADAFLSLTRGG